MDAFSLVYTVAFLFPIILITALCIRCRKKIPIHITETGYYDDKAPYTPPTSFMIINRPPILPRTVSSQSSMFHQDVMITIPRSPVSKSRRSSVVRDLKVSGYHDGCDSIPLIASASILKNNSIEDDRYDDEGEDPNYTNGDPSSGYIEILPETADTVLGPVLVVTCDVDNRASFSSVGTDENYVNVGDSGDAKASSTDGNYVNVGDSSDMKGGSLEYVNVEEAEKHSSSVTLESEDDDTPEYENVEKGHKG
ncbi:linker for activation of T-cells family member 1 [Rhinoderma darwinii]|uniref:linker for activation of T-cells family member 1 n=1 Tax=Rhinoderma darwinii TaxID=43563 RepID=UPI003F67FAE9